MVGEEAVLLQLGSIRRKAKEGGGLEEKATMRDTWSPNVVCKKAAQYSGQRGLEVAVSGPDGRGRTLVDGGGE